MKSITNRAFMAKKMYIEPKTDTLPMEPASMICVSGDGRVGVQAVNPINFNHKVE